MLWAAVAAVACAGFVALAYRRRWQWTGFPEARMNDGSGVLRPAKTIWDWLQLLVVPLALAGLGFLLNSAESARQQDQENARAAREQRAALDAGREQALRAYVSQMSGLMLDRGLLRSRASVDVRELARTITLTTVRRLDSERKGVVVRFLAEARLLRATKRSPRGRSAPVDLRGADLRSAALGDAELFDVNLTEVDLRGADLSRSNLTGAVMEEADLRGARLRDALTFAAESEDATDLAFADLRGADLRGTQFNGADLFGGDFRGQDLSRIELSGALLQDSKLARANLERSDLRQANLIFAGLAAAHVENALLERAHLDAADLRGADLRGADLRGATLTHAKLSNADLHGADMRGTDLRDATGVNLAGARGTPAHRASERCPALTERTPRPWTPDIAKTQHAQELSGVLRLGPCATEG